MKSVIANGDGTYDVAGSGAPGQKGDDVAGAAAALAGDDPRPAIAALSDATERIEKLITELEDLLAPEEFDTENPR